MTVIMHSRDKFLVIRQIDFKGPFDAFSWRLKNFSDKTT